MWLGSTIITTCPNLPSPVPLEWPTFQRHLWRRRKHFESSPTRRPFLRLLHILSSKRLSEEHRILLLLSQTPGAVSEGLAPGSTLRSCLGSTAACARSVRMLSPHRTALQSLPLSSPRSSVSASVSLSLLHTYTHHSFTEGEKPLSFLPSLI